jgi:DNA-directed RNA polymerase subunit RPC12/RpoP
MDIPKLIAQWTALHDACLAEAQTLVGAQCNAESCEAVRGRACGERGRETGERGGAGMRYHCPDCGFMITDEMRLKSRIDYLCDRCRKRHWSEFEARADEREERETNP